MWHESRQKRPYNVYRVSRCLQCVNVPPDSAEQNAHSTHFLVDGFQSRKSAGNRLPVRAVPTGLSDVDHFFAGLEAESPVEREPEAPGDLEFAVRTIVDKGSAIKEWRAGQFKVLTDLVDRCY